MYDVAMNTHSHGALGAHESEASIKEYLKFAGIIALILVVSIVLSLPGLELTAWMRHFMGVFFLIFAAFKLVDIKVFAYTFAGYDIIAKRVRAYAFAYPFIEALLGVLFLIDAIPVARNITTLVIMSVGAVGVYLELRKQSHIKCACLGKYVRLPLTTISLSEDVGMGLMAAAMLFM